MLQKKQDLATELDRSEKERRQQQLEAEKKTGDSAADGETEKMIELIAHEQNRIAAYEAAFQEIKEATGVSDVNEVIQRFKTQEETHQSLLQMTREAQLKTDELRKQLTAEKAAQLEAEYAQAQDEGEAPPEFPDLSDQGSQGVATQQSPEEEARLMKLAKKQLQRTQVRWKKVCKVRAETQASVQHIVDALEPLREKDEVIAPMSEDTLIQHLQFATSKIELIGQAFREMEDEHTDLLLSQTGPSAGALQPLHRARTPAGELGLFDRGKDEREADKNDSDDEFEEELEEELLDRNALKKMSTSILDKGAKKKKPRRRRVKGDD